jgi:uncharacterized protein (TIGR02147 family)
MTVKTADICEFADYRKFLQARFQQLKAKNSKFSYQFCASRLKTSRNYIKLILDGKRHTSLDKIEALSKLFKLDKFESQYMLYLFLRSSVKEPFLLEHFGAVLGSMKQRKLLGVLEHRESRPETEQIYANWERWLVHTLVKLKGFDPDPQAMQKFTLEGIPASSLARAFEDLKRGKMVVKEEGKWRQSEFVFTRPSNSETSSYQIFHLGLKKAADFLDKVEKFRPNQHYMMAVGMDEKSFQEVRDKFVELRNFIIEKGKQAQEADAVFFTCNHIFRVAGS